KSFSKAANSFLIIAGGYLFLMQMHGYEHVAFAEEFTSKSVPDQELQKLEVNQNPDWKDTITVIIPARGDKEYKLYLPDGARLKYLWKTNGEKLFYDFHGEPAGDTTGYFKSFRKNTESKSNGTLIASFEGTHGWYWRNNTSSAVKVILKDNGDYQRMDLKKSLFDVASPQKNNSTKHDTID
ncbi:MAG: hypothetical protein KAQ67_10265, partial [Gammaproteobacteria bacterium]|nr:hypothetical protein [Gammaproteobacteria bacterium]